MREKLTPLEHAMLEIIKNNPNADRLGIAIKYGDIAGGYEKINSLEKKGYISTHGLVTINIALL